MNPRNKRGDDPMNAGGQREMQQRRLIPGRVPVVDSEAPAENWKRRLSARLLGVRRKAATVVLFALSLSLLGYAIFGHDGLVAYQHKQHQAAELHRQILGLQKENQRLALHDQRLQSDRDTIEYEAREQMHYTRPGEVIYTLPEAPSGAQHK
ncbi:MAG: septum formation initiator family protein [Acidobacteriaceae bacterium]